MAAAVLRAARLLASVLAIFMAVRAALRGRWDEATFWAVVDVATTLSSLSERKS